MTSFALVNARVLTETGFVNDVAVIVKDGLIADLRADEDCGDVASTVDLKGGLLLPGFFDVQVNGGGGVLFNDEPTVDGVAAIAKAHRAYGTTSLLPTLISDDLDKVALAIKAVDDAIEANVPGVVGVHVEGPFLNETRKGIHDAGKLRPLTKDALAILTGAKRARVVLTLAPECVDTDDIQYLASRGVRVCAGHTNATYDEAKAALRSGVTGFTHLFNAMSPMLSRAPGVIPAALESDAWCGVIVDGLHVHPAMLRLALNAKADKRFMLVTDAMPCVGSDVDHFYLNGARIHVRDGKCFSDDGTLAGAALTMIDAVKNAVSMLSVDLETASRMASAEPAAFMGVGKATGSISAGKQADLVWLDRDLRVIGVWIRGVADDRALAAA